MWTFGEKTYSNRLILNLAGFTSTEIAAEALAAAGVEIVDVPVRHGNVHPANLAAQQQWIEESGLTLLAATAGCTNAKDAVTTAYQARDLLGAPTIILEVTGQATGDGPDLIATLDAAGKLLKQGFDLLAVTTGDPVAAQRLLELGCSGLLLRGGASGPWRGMADIMALRPLRARLPKAVLMLDADLARPSEVALALELGFDAVRTGQGLSAARDPITMAEAFADAAMAGRIGFDAGLAEPPGSAERDPVLGTPFWHTQPD
jgi:thiazole synthase